MTLVFSKPMAIGTLAPDFSLLDTVSGQLRNLSELKSGVATVIMFICNHCPYVKHIETALAALVRDYQAKGVSFIGISSNDVKNYPEDAPDKMRIKAESLGYTFPYLYDETQAVAKAYQAECTPEFYIFDANLLCCYHGRFDESSPGKEVPVTGNELRQALDALLAGQPIPPAKPSMGCNIKWI